MAENMIQDNETDIPTDLLGLWGYWSVKNEVAVNVDIDSPSLDKLSGLFLGFGSGDRSKWAALLPHLTKLKYLVSWTGNNPQSFFDAVTKMTWLERLCFGRLTAQDISGIAQLSKLQYLCVHQMAGPKTLEPITKLRSLRVLELGLNPSTSDLQCFSQNELGSLRSIILYGNKSRIDLPSIKPLGAIPSLEYLSIPTVRAGDDDLESVISLPKLKLIHLAKKGWPDASVELLRKKGVYVKQGIEEPRAAHQ